LHVQVPEGDRFALGLQLVQAEGFDEQVKQEELQGMQVVSDRIKPGLHTQVNPLSVEFDLHLRQDNPLFGSQEAQSSWQMAIQSPSTKLKPGLHSQWVLLPEISWALAMHSVQVLLQVLQSALQFDWQAPVVAFLEVPGGQLHLPLLRTSPLLHWVHWSIWFPEQFLHDISHLFWQ
jgi:hypothetical protein